MAALVALGIVLCLVLLGCGGADAPLVAAGMDKDELLDRHGDPDRWYVKGATQQGMSPKASWTPDDLRKPMSSGEGWVFEYTDFSGKGQVAIWLRDGKVTDSKEGAFRTGGPAGRGGREGRGGGRGRGR
jgi:hypothetical protein